MDIKSEIDGNSILSMETEKKLLIILRRKKRGEL